MYTTTKTITVDEHRRIQIDLELPATFAGKTVEIQIIVQEKSEEENHLV